jgi:FAD dependent oxidoreductase
VTQRIAIIGGGPIGLEAALYARALGHDVVIYERGDVAESVKSWGFVRLFSPWEMNTTSLGWKTLEVSAPRGTNPTGDELRGRYLLPLAVSPTLKRCLRPHVSVISIGKDDYAKSDAIGKSDRATSPFRILVRDADGSERIDKSDVVLDCSGTYTNHRWSGRGGVPAPGERALESKIHYTLPDILGRDRERFIGRHTLVLGAGFSAATALLNLEQLYRENNATKVSWAIRRIGQAMQAIHEDPLPWRAALVEFSIGLADHPPPWLQYLGNCTLEQITRSGGQFTVTLRYNETDLSLAVDEVIPLVGYAPDASLYEQLQIHQCYATAGPMKMSAALLGAGAAGGDCMTAGAALGPDTLKNPEPNFFILGAKSFGTNSNFLLQIGHQQIRDAFRLIQNDAGLDLYGRGGGGA